MLREPTLNEIKAHITHYVEHIKPPIQTLLDYRKKIACESPPINNCNIKRNLANTLLFISDRPNYYFLRMSSALRSLGYSTIFVTRWGASPDEAQYFDETFLYDSFSDLEVLADLKFKTIFVQSWIGWFFLPVYIFFISQSKLVCNINDSPSLLFDKHKNLEKLGLQLAEYTMDLKCENFIYNNFNKVLTPYFTDTEFSQNSQNRNTIFLPCYPINTANFQLSQLHIHTNKLLFAGGIPYDHKPDDVFSDAKLQNIMRQLIEQEIDVTILNNPQLETTRHNYPYFFELSNSNTFFTFKAGIPPWDLREIAHNFYYGLMIYDFSETIVSKKHYENIIPTKVFTYLEIGLPIIVSTEMKQVAALVEEKQLGFSIKHNEIQNLKQIIKSKSNRYNHYKKNVAKYCETHNFTYLLANDLSNILNP